MKDDIKQDAPISLVECDILKLCFPVKKEVREIHSRIRIKHGDQFSGMMIERLNKLGLLAKSEEHDMFDGYYDIYYVTTEKGYEVSNDQR